MKKRTQAFVALRPQANTFALVLGRGSLETMVEKDVIPGNSACVRTASAGAIAVGAFALGAFAVGALAIGALAIRRLAVQKATIEALQGGGYPDSVLPAGLIRIEGNGRTGENDLAS